MRKNRIIVEYINNHVWLANEFNDSLLNIIDLPIDG